jgi:hypothetical protein
MHSWKTLKASRNGYCQSIAKLPNYSKNEYLFNKNNRTRATGGVPSRSFKELATLSKSYMFLTKVIIGALENLEGIEKWLLPKYCKIAKLFKK